MVIRWRGLIVLTAECVLMLLVVLAIRETVAWSVPLPDPMPRLRSMLQPGAPGSQTTGPVAGAVSQPAAGPTLAPTATPARRLDTFEPDKIGQLEQQTWEAYYYRDWPRLSQLLLELFQGQFGLYLPQALEAATLASRAQLAFAERGARDGVAEQYMRQLYALGLQPSGGSYDPARVAKLEVAWWTAHRNQSQAPDLREVEEALTALYAELVTLSPGEVGVAARHRARAVQVSDQWQNQGKDRASPLLKQVREELVLSYQALHDTLEAHRHRLPPGQADDASRSGGQARDGMKLTAP
jgi:hypothetical protein